jgi:CheY-like chemotaxis protein
MGTAPSGGSGSRPRLRGIRVLLVEDDPDTSDVVATMLRDSGAEVVCAHNAATGIQEFERQHFDVIVTDYALGRGLNGFGLLERVRAQPVDARIPVVGYSAHAGLVPDEEQAAFTAYAAKPLFVDNVVGLVRGVIQRRPDPGVA